MKHYINNKRKLSLEEEDDSVTESAGEKNYELKKKIKIEEKKESKHNYSNTDDDKTLLEFENKFNKKLEEIQKKIEKNSHLIENLIQKREIDKKEIQQLNFEVRFLLQEREKEKNSITYLLKERELEREEIQKMKSNIIYLQKKRKYDGQLIEELSTKVDKLYEFVFSTNLRKLVKKLLEFVVDHYNKYIIYDEKEKKFYFTDLPIILKSFENKKDDTLNSLNKFLDIILYYYNKSSFNINFTGKSYSKINDITTFEKSADFFQYFGICKNDEKILTTLIPEKYYTNINDVDFDKKMSELISKVCKKSYK